MTATAKSAAEVLAEAENPDHVRVESAYILQRQDLQAAYDQLLAERRTAERLSNSIGTAELVEINRQIADLEVEIAEALVEFKFRSVGYQVWTDLIRKHPPTKEQRAQGHDTNPDTHRPAVMAACCVEPAGADDEFFARLAKVYTAAQFEALWLAVFTANIGSAALPKAVVARIGSTHPPTAESESSASEADGHSRPASSSDG